MKTQNWLLLKSFMNKATKNILFLLSSKMHKWKLTSKIINFRRKHPIKLFNKSKSSLYDSIRDIDDQYEGPSYTHCIRRTKSSIARNNDDENDVDQRAEMFIANFKRQLRLERQISLELRYCK